MTVLRTALRLCTKHALLGTPAARPTMAANRLYDSRIGDFDPDSKIGDELPTVVLLTDKDEGEALSDQNGGPPFRRMIDLVIEFGIIQMVADDQENPVDDEFHPEWPDTDARHEAALDIFETQIIHRLAYDMEDKFSLLWREIARPTKYECHRQVMDDSGVKIAARVLTLTCDCGDDEPIINTPDDTKSGIEALPEPLRSLALAMPSGSEGAAICEGIAASLSQASATAFDGFEMQVTNADGEAASDMVSVDIEIRSSGKLPQVFANSPIVEIDYAKGTYQSLILAADITTLSVRNWPRVGLTGRLILEITQVNAFSIDGWPDGTSWVGGVEPVITTGAGKRDIIVLTTATNGAEIFANVIGQDYHEPNP